MRTTRADTLVAAWDAGVRTFDTARAYPGNEELVRAALRDREARIVTKVGMDREGERWIPNGRAKAIRAHAEASRAALGRAADLVLLHAPDPETPLSTSVRALASLVDDGLARAVGLSNVSLRELEEALAIAPVAAVEIALGPWDDDAIRGGVVHACDARGIAVYAYAVLGGPGRVARVRKDPVLLELARGLGASPEEVLIAYAARLAPHVIPIVGARTPEAARSAVRGAALALDEATLARLDERFPWLGVLRNGRARRVEPVPGREVVLVTGIPGAGKSRETARFAGWERLNRDAMGGTLDKVHRRLDERLASGTERVVLDNTYVTRAERAEPIAIAHRRGARVRAVHIDVPVEDALINVVQRMLERHGALLDREAIKDRGKKDPNLFLPRVVHEKARLLELPREDEGFDEIEVRPFVRAPRDGAEGTAIPLEVLEASPSVLDRAVGPTLVFAWRPAGGPLPSGPFDAGICPHAAGPPSCWCRPPLPGLWVAFAGRHHLGTGRLLGETPFHERLARAWRLTYERVRP